MPNQTVIEQAVQRLADAAAPGTRIILFGSHARGSAGSTSDLDLLIVEPGVENPGEESVRLRRTLRGLCLAADVVVVSPQYVEEWREVPGSLVHAALSEGRELAS